MKILKIELENINSLKGKWVIDLMDPSYEENHNLFAICGDIGTGKSSILDAITLAIYGSTPRQGLIFNSAKGNEVMTRDMGNCYARVTYKCSKGTFVSEWSQRRAHDRADGNLQDANGMVYRLEDPENPIFNGKTGAKRELALVNEKNILLDYSQFCRSIMLAQGEFSRFLSCEEEERASILEKLNGSEKYRLIAEKSGDHWSAAKAAFDKADSAYGAVAQNVLTPEQVEAKTAEKNQLQAELDSLTISLKEIDLLLNWYRNLENSKVNLTESEGKLTAAKERLDGFADDAKVLENGLRAKNCETSFQRVDNLEKDKVKRVHELDNLKIQLEALVSKVEKAEKDAADQGKVLADAETFIRNNSDLWKVVRQLDSDVKNAQSNVAEANNLVKTLGSQYADRETEERNLATEVSVLKGRIDKGEVFLQEHERDKDIAAILSGFKTQIASAREQQKKLADTSASVASDEKKSKDLENDLAKRKEKVQQLEAYLQEHSADASLPQVIAESRGYVEQLIAADREKNTQEAAVKQCKKDAKSLDSLLEANNKDIKEIEQQQLELFNNEVIVLADVIQKHLVDGEACPVCGSKEHPSCCESHEVAADDGMKASDVASRIRVLNEKMESARREKNSVESRSKLNNQALENAEMRLKEAVESFGDASQRLSQAWMPWNQVVAVETCRDVLKTLQEASDVYVQKERDNATALDGVREVSSLWDQLKTRLVSSYGLLDQQKAELDNLVAAMETLVSPWISNFRQEDLEAIFEELKKRSETFEKSLKKVEELKAELATAGTKLGNATCNKADAKNRLDEAQSALKAAMDKSAELMAARMEKFGEQDVDSVEKQAQQKVDRAKQDSEAAVQALNQLKTEAKGFESKKSQREADIVKDEADLKSARGDFSEELQKNNFADAAAFMSARLADEKIAALQKTQTELKENAVAAKQSRDDAQKAYDKCLAEHSDVEGKDVLLQKQEALLEHQKQLQESYAAVSGCLSTNVSNADKLLQLKQERDAAYADYSRWNTMRDWFGVKDGRDFSKFVQGLTFKSLLKLANKQLHEIKGRYTLIPDKDLSFRILDTHFENSRSISNLSGGEKFLVSLSLALGIAEFASRNVKIESLFLDEGFGTLDNETLDTVMESLRAQRSKGKMLGVITHVESVMDGIDQKIVLVSNRNGHSTITGPGVSRG